LTFHTLERDEQIERLEACARDALEFFDMPDAALTLVGYTNNAVFEVVDSSSQFVKNARYTLRVHRPGLKPLSWIQSELTWLSSIRRHTHLAVPEPAGPVYGGAIHGSEDKAYCTLLGWVRGVTYEAAAMTPHHLRMIGQFAAELHTFSETYSPPEGFERPRMDAEGFFGDESPYQSEAEAALFNGRPQAMMKQAESYIRETMARFGEGSDLFGLVHGDLIAKNILFDEETVGAIDFDDCSFSYYLYDLTPMLWVSRDMPQFNDFYAAIWEGYNNVRPQPDENRDLLNALLLGRHAASCRWIAGNAAHPSIRGNARSIIEGRSAEIEHFLEHGSFRH